MAREENNDDLDLRFYGKIAEVSRSLYSIMGEHSLCSCRNNTDRSNDTKPSPKKTMLFNNPGLHDSDFYLRDFDTNLSTENYIKDLQKTYFFNNPQCIELLAKHHGIDQCCHTSLSRFKVKKNESIGKLREKQSCKWSMDMVGEGVKHFREKAFDKAMKCFDQALSFYPDNVEGYVARGALKANRNELQDAIQDFREALKLCPTHKNAKKYLIETSLSVAKGFENLKQWKNALNCYREILNLEPRHGQSKERSQQILRVLSEKIVVGTSKESRGNSSQRNRNEKHKRKSSSSSSSDESSDAESDRSSSNSNEWIEKRPRTETSHRHTRHDVRHVSSSRTKKTANTERVDYSKEETNHESNSFTKKLKSFSSTDLQLVSKLLRDKQNTVPSKDSSSSTTTSSLRHHHRQADSRRTSRDSLDEETTRREFAKKKKRSKYSNYS